MVVFLAPMIFGDVSSKIHKLMTVYSDNGQFNGTVLVKKGDELLYKRAFGWANREWDVPNILQSEFLIGSISKSFTALMTLILVEERLIDLNATINTYLPNYQGAASNTATIHQMLTHISGIPNHGGIPDLSKKRVRWHYDSEEYLELLKEVKIQSKPGEKFGYSGIAYDILAIICEKVSGKTFANLLQEKIFLPLGMNNTKLDSNLDFDKKRAQGYEYYLLEGFLNPSYISMSIIKGSGGILSTVEDLAKFTDECFNKQTLISKAMYQKMFTSFVKDWQHYGYGWWITKDKIQGRELNLISHGGSIDGYKAYLTRVVEDGIDVILLQNNYFRTEVGVKFNYALTNEILDILYGGEPVLPKQSIVKEMGIVIGKEGVDSGIELYKKLEGNNAYYVDDYELNELACELYQRHLALHEETKNNSEQKDLLKVLYPKRDLKKEAFFLFEFALTLHPNSFILNYTYGRCLFENNVQKGRTYLKKSTEIFSKDEKNEKHSNLYKQALKLLGKKNS